MKIWKWQLEVSDTQTITMPVNTKILTVQLQNNIPTLWALCDENAEKIDKQIYIIGTGNSIEEPLGEYIGTFQLYGGSLVFHVFEK